MKKSILASLFAGLFAVSAFAGDDGHMMKIELKKELGQGTTINLNHDGDTQIFEFTEEELQDSDFINTRLADLDDDTKKAVLNALNGIHFDGIFAHLDPWRKCQFCPVRARSRRHKQQHA